MSVRRRIPRFVANPFTALALLAYLVVDLSLLVRDLPNADSTVARVFSGRNAPAPAISHHAFIVACRPTGNTVIDCKGLTAAQARNTVPVGATPILDVVFVQESSRSGFWAPTLLRREARFDWDPHQRLPAAELPLIRVNVTDELLRLGEVSPSDAEALRFADLYDGRLLPFGLLRTVAGLVAAVALPIALYCLPGYFIGLYVERVVRRRGLCTRCAYPVAGLATCPECGLLVPAAADPGILRSDLDGPA